MSGANPSTPTIRHCTSTFKRQNEGASPSNPPPRMRTDRSTRSVDAWLQLHANMTKCGMRPDFDEAAILAKFGPRIGAGPDWDDLQLGVYAAEHIDWLPSLEISEDDLFRFRRFNRAALAIARQDGARFEVEELHVAIEGLIWRFLDHPDKDERDDIWRFFNRLATTAPNPGPGEM